MHLAPLFALSLALIVAACTERAPDPPPEASGALAAVPYALAEPDARYRLAPRLREISGLTLLANGNLAAVQDEDGDLFELDPASGGIVAERPFYNRGDYEGVERVDDVIWVVESDGDLYRIAGEGEADKLETGLKRANDVEGLAYDARGQRLLLACKESPGPGQGRVRAIYAYDLATGQLSDAPVYTLDREALDAGGAPFKPS
ncbi:MAG: SdiA-regulated domain-containing protein, partial [Bacteroidota bacterium]